MDAHSVVTPSPSPAPVVLVCEPGFVPGWLDENGEPQGCVNNGPGEVATTVVVDTTAVASTSQLAETGADPLLAGLLALALITCGALLRFRRS